MTHLDAELLSAYVDGEVTAAERASVEAHLPDCPECSDLAAAFGFARAQLRRLPDPPIPELHRKQLWREINRARRAPANRWRALVAVAGTAAAIVAFAGLTMLGTSTGPNVLATRVEHSETRWSSDDLSGLLEVPTAVAMEAEPAAGDTGSTKPALSAPQEDADAPSSSKAYGELLDQENHGARIATCESQISPGGDGGAVAFRYIVARFERTPVYILVYGVPREEPDRREVFVVRRSDCKVLEHRSAR